MTTIHDFETKSSNCWAKISEFLSTIVDTEYLPAFRGVYDAACGQSSTEAELLSSFFNLLADVFPGMFIKLSTRIT